MKIKIGILFGGRSREREISFAGGRTVYDNLNKSIFEPIPIFVDSFGNFILLNWEFVYKGSIRDFYPPASALHNQSDKFQIYAESLGELSQEQQYKLIEEIGIPIKTDEIKKHIDFAFLCLHGPFGEDGRIQGLLEYLEIPYSGSGILPSSIGINKAIQKKLMINAGFNSPEYVVVKRNDYLNHPDKIDFEKIIKKVGLPLVIKPANQGSSIGISILNEKNKNDFTHAIEKAFFINRIHAKEWNELNKEEKIEWIRKQSDIREGIGVPVKINSDTIYSPESLLDYLNDKLQQQNYVQLEALDGESEILIEEFIQGKEFSCIVLEDASGKAIALPPTEIRKGKELFDYRSKYLPGLSRKITPIDIENNRIEAIRKECENLFYALAFDVYARIDGFITEEGKIFLNDPNTTSGMMPSSFFFHQAAEIGLNPSQFISYIIRTSIAKRIIDSKTFGKFNHLLTQLDQRIADEKNQSDNKIKVAVILGGYSSERHISVESGRNVFEKLSSSSKYAPLPVFLTGSETNHQLFQIPINVLLKDNADDIKEKVENYTIHPEIEKIIRECEAITEKYASKEKVMKPQALSYQDLATKVGMVFIALHGRPGEDGAIQSQLEKVNLPYNGSGRDSSLLTIDKFTTNETLKKNGFLVAEHLLVSESDWTNNRADVEKVLLNKIKLPFIAKPVDDGCSSAVKKIKSIQEFEAFCQLIFRKTEALVPEAAELLHIKPKEEFPMKNVILVEELISKKEAKHFLEITGGMLTKFNSAKNLEYEVFEASETLVEGDVLSLEEKFLAGQGQNITPARYAKNNAERTEISTKVKEELKRAAQVLNVIGYCRIDAFVRIFENKNIEVIFIEVNSLPGMTPATCIFHQAAINHYKPYEFIDAILSFGKERNYN